MRRICLISLCCVAGVATGADSPQWGQAWSRNMVSAERGLPETFDPQTGLNIKWVAPLGTETHSTPVVSGGRVFIGTNNGEPRDPKHQGDRGVLMCLDESNGQLLWQWVVPKRTEDPYFDWPRSGISSPVTVEADRVYVVNNRGEVVCLDTKGLADGNDGAFQEEGVHMSVENPLEPGPMDADILWLFDLTHGAGIWSHDAAHSSILIDGPYLYLNTGTGVDNTHKRIRTPNAPSLVVLEKATGRLIARENEGMAPRIFHCTWSAPSLGVVDGRRLIFFAGGDGILYAFSALEFNADLPTSVRSLEKVWSFDFDPGAPKEDVHRYNTNRRDGPSNFYGMPVFQDGRIYLAGGGDLFWGKTQAWLKCIDATGKGDLGADAVRWEHPLVRHTVSSVALQDGLVYVADCGRTLHCLDERTGQLLWTHEAKSEFWASPLVADGKVYLGTRRGDFCVLRAGREKEVLSTVELGRPISATATAANGVLYVATMSHLYAVRASAD